MTAPDPAAYVTEIGGYHAGTGPLHHLFAPMREPEPLPEPEPEAGL